MKSAKSKSSLSKIGKKVSFWSMKKSELVVIDGCAILLVVKWPTNRLVSYYIANYCDFVFLKLQSHDMAVVFDRYHDFSIKSSTRANRGTFSARTLFLTPSSPLPGKSVTLTSASCKSQIIRYITDGLIQRAVSGFYSSALLITRLLATPTKITRGIVKERQNPNTSHEQADLIMVQQACQKKFLIVKLTLYLQYATIQMF